MRRRTATAVVALAASFALGGCSSAPDAMAHAGAKGPRLAVSGAYIPQPVMADMAAGYFTVSNTGDTDAELTSVSSDLTADITLHTTADNRMRKVNSLTVPAGGRLTLSSGGTHLMLRELAHKPVAGDKVAMELHFAKADPIGVQVPVEPAGYRPKG
ncbi:copper chaperone PCu(A)C [Streptomyces sp. H10-C2]|uniref:copper chaperone PCu(A)C n=1 Tax=unclassified Streptomyces TaxID=2593676 RepID=UPI0024BB96BB|nr:MULTISPECIES: copper chaperone PCu(A)C [unclassified Streptomyces]MDJ0342076.1 copper chaperone PCu(A)C [Streptomyces sp. PH10-H1]MDJ0368418.1 copper chaperone PCu(A)C [Streptomyces sp. H10-C2]